MGHEGDMQFELRGKYFDLLPDDAVITLSSNNDLPQEYRYSTGTVNVAEIIEKSSTRLLVKTTYDSPYGSAKYVGAIVSNDRSVLYWENTTRPLP